MVLFLRLLDRVSRPEGICAAAALQAAKFGGNGAANAGKWLMQWRFPLVAFLAVAHLA